MILGAVTNRYTRVSTEMGGGGGGGQDTVAAVMVGAPERPWGGSLILGVLRALGPS